MCMKPFRRSLSVSLCPSVLQFYEINLYRNSDHFDYIILYFYQLVFNVTNDRKMNKPIMLCATCCESINLLKLK